MPTNGQPSPPNTDTAVAPNRYEAWYHTPRGNWIGKTEFELISRLLAAPAGASLLDIGCGTGYFTRQFAAQGLDTTGLDTSLAMTTWAAQSDQKSHHVVANALSLPFGNHSFDYTTAITSLCFITTQQAALHEMLRVTRKRIVLGLLNRHSLLYWKKGRGGGSGAYRGAHWHSAREIRQTLQQLGVTGIDLYSAVYLPSGGVLSRAAEHLLNRRILLGAFMAVVIDMPA